MEVEGAYVGGEGVEEEEEMMMEEEEGNEDMMMMEEEGEGFGEEEEEGLDPSPQMQEYYQEEEEEEEEGPGPGPPPRSASQVPHIPTEDIAAMQMMSKDSECLYDVKVGFEPLDNVKNPMKGFSIAYQDYFFPLIDGQSGILFEIVQAAEQTMYKANENLLRAYKKPVAIPSSRLAFQTEGPEIRLRIMDPSESLEVPMVPPKEKHPSGKRVVGAGAAATVEMKKTDDELARLEKHIVAAEKAYSAEKLKALLIPFDKGWKREIVLRSHGSGAAKKLGDVYYFSPQGVKYRSSKQVASYLSKNPGEGLRVENFSFQKARVSYNSDHETVRAAQGGRNLNPVKNQQKAVEAKLKAGLRPKGVADDDEDADDMAATNGLGNNEDNAEESQLKGQVRGGRRSIQPPKRYATAQFVPEPMKRAKVAPKINHEKEKDANRGEGGGMQMGMLPPKYRASEEEKSAEQMLHEFRVRRGRPPKTKSDMELQQEYLASRSNQSADEGPMFGISALTQGTSLSQFAKGYGAGMSTDGYDDMNDMEMDGTQMMQQQGGRGKRKGELLPCSIRCPGMTGEIPTLQCKRCLCLYHPTCLGLGLPNQPYRNFFCSNCEGDPVESSKLTRPSLMQMKGMRPPMKRSEPPPLIQLNKGGGLPAKFIQGLRRLPTNRMPNLGGGMVVNKIPASNQSTFARGTMPQMGRMGLPMGLDFRRGRGRPPRMSSTPHNPHLQPATRGSLTITPISMPRQRGSFQQGGPTRGGGSMGSGGTMMIRKSVPGFPPQQQRLRQMGLKKPAQLLPQQMMPLKQQRYLQTPLLKPRQTVASIMRMPGAIGQGLRNSSLFHMDKDTGRVRALTSSVMRGGIGPRPNAQFQRYAQSVVTIGGKKYLALPKNSSGATPNSATSGVSAVNNTDIAPTATAPEEDTSTVPSDAVPPSPPPPEIEEEEAAVAAATTSLPTSAEGEAATA